MVYGPYIKTVPAGSYTAVYRMMVDNNTADNSKVVRVEVFDFISGKVRASQSITRKQFGGAFSYQDFGLSFNAYGNESLELRIFWEDTSYVRVDRVMIQP